jgi:chromatin remodeling complex protein RSC6
MPPIKKSVVAATPIAAPKAAAASTSAAAAPKKAPKVVAVVAPAAEAPAAPEIAPSVMADLAARIAAVAAAIKSIQATFKVAQKEFEKLNKTKAKADKKRANARTSPSGFAKPTRITDELCAFLGVDKGSELARTEVTKRVNSYVKENSLFDTANKRVILPNATLKKLLGCTDDDKITYFNLQSYMKHHFIKAA